MIFVHGFMNFLTLVLIIIGVMVELLWWDIPDLKIRFPAENGFQSLFQSMGKWLT